jgi:hypothetical protein
MDAGTEDDRNKLLEMEHSVQPDDAANIQYTSVCIKTHLSISILVIDYRVLLENRKVQH